VFTPTYKLLDIITDIIIEICTTKPGISNSCHLGGWDLEDQGSRPARGNSSISKIPRAKWTGGVVQVLEHLLCKGEALSSNSSIAKKKKKSLTYPYFLLCLVLLGVQFNLLFKPSNTASRSNPQKHIHLLDLFY
jgi:hypothetical protein